MEILEEKGWVIVKSALQEAFYPLWSVWGIDVRGGKFIDDEKIEAEGNKRRVLHMNHPEIESVRAFLPLRRKQLDYLEQTSHLTLVIIDINMPGMSGAYC